MRLVSKNSISDVQTGGVYAVLGSLLATAKSTLLLFVCDPFWPCSLLRLVTTAVTELVPDCPMSRVSQHRTHAHIKCVGARSVSGVGHVQSQPVAFISCCVAPIPRGVLEHCVCVLVSNSWWARCCRRERGPPYLRRRCSYHATPCYLDFSLSVAQGALRAVLVLRWGHFSLFMAEVWYCLVRWRVWALEYPVCLVGSWGHRIAQCGFDFIGLG